MKKFLLSSIIMLGVCGAANAQTGAKTKKNDMEAARTASPSAAAAAATPQKAAIMPASDVAAPATRTAADKEAAATAPAAAKSSSDGATTVNAAGEVVPVNASRKEAKMAAAKAANEKKNN